MTGLLASTHRLPPAGLHRAMACLTFLGGDRSERWSDDCVEIDITRKHWELSDDFSGNIAIFARDHLVVAADATIYDRPALISALAAAGVRPIGSTPTHLIAAAYRAWGVRLAEHLNGDYAFVIWDSIRQRLVAGRDPTGIRPLFYSEIGPAVIVASSARAIAESLSRGNVLNLSCLGGQVAGLINSPGTETAYDGVDPVPPAHLLISGSGHVRLERYWRPPLEPDRNPMGEADARVALRELVATAVADRMSSGRTTVWMDGAVDSTAVFAAGQHRLPALDRSRLRPVSISYPPDDPGSEDDLVEAAAEYWGAKVQWLQSSDIPLLDSLEERAQESDEPPAHLQELWNRALARATRAAGSRVALDGTGGDRLFHVSDIVLADLVRGGRWLEALRHARACGHGWSQAMRLGILPLAPPALSDLASRLAGPRFLRHYLERPPAPWMRADFLARHELRERDLAVLRAVRAASLAHTESVLLLTLPAWDGGAGYMRGALLQEGIENRSPLLDRRIVEFALSRPIQERASVHAPKTLLRGAMQGLLPARVLELGSRPAGTIRFSRLRMREAYPGLVERLFAQPLRIADMGMVDPDALRTAASRVSAGQADDDVRANLFHAMKVEFWLRGLEVRAANVDGAARVVDSALRQNVANCAGQSPVNLDGSIYVSET